ncbi:hypothetical protein QBC47DRAFT_354847 [Echria macrotheca]|uniref:Uncharacterized protein n=1 Tax=Echria macrotheca TaxID=438768 RepID=A0AAJ0B0P9_9PEZI|nr:hypothetical protein QBC47DRAFT_354847 [Echria macrotheca]
MSASALPKAPSSIPNITTLRNDLDYGDIRLPRCAAFIDDTNAFRRKFKTSRGVDGVDLHDWKSRDGQAGLSEMAVAYLEKEGNGRIFWPDDTSSKNYNKYQYSKDRFRILNLVKQLFFRLNQQQFRNHKYKHKNQPETHAQDERGGSEQTAIDVDSIIFKAPSTEPPRERISTEESFPDFEKFYEEHPGYNEPVARNTDVYEVPISNPPSPPRMRQFEAINHAPNNKRGVVADNSAESPQRKRQKRQPKSSLATDTCPEPATTFPDSPGQQRKSSRAKRQVRYDGYLGLDEMNWMSPERSPSPEPDLPSTLPRTLSPETSTTISKTPINNPSSNPTEPAAQDAAAPRSAAEQQNTLPLTSVPLRSGILPQGQDEISSEPKHASPAVPGSLEKAQTGGTSGALIQDAKLLNPPTLEQPKQSPTLSTPGSGTSINKPSVNFTYYVVLSRSAARVSQRWNPQGRFQDKTLAELLKELPFHDQEPQGLTFTVEGDCWRTVEHIPSDDEDGFAALKKYINIEIRKWFVRQQQNLNHQKPSRLAVVILIEPMNQDQQEHDVDGLGELDLEWW